MYSLIIRIRERELENNSKRGRRKKMASEDANSTVAAAAEAVSVELPAPEGWKKKFTPKKGGTPRRNEITFISPTGEEITNKRQLDQYLRAHPGGPLSSEFDWGTGDTPRRSSRLGAKAKAIESPEDEKPKKRERKSSGKKGIKDKKDSEDGENKVSDAEAKEFAVAEMKDNEGSIDKTEENANMSEAEGEAEKVSEKEKNENVEVKVDQEKENSEILPKDGGDGEDKALEAAKDAAAADETKGSEDVEMKNNEGNSENEPGKKIIENMDVKTVGHHANGSSEKANQEPEEGSENAEKEKPESFEPYKEEDTGEKARNDGDASAGNDSSKENRDNEIHVETQHSLNYDDVKHQPKASPVNC